MSKTEVRNGSAIERAALEVAMRGEGVFWGYFTIRDVAKETKRSKPTVQKYLKILEAHGQVKACDAGRYPGATKMYRWTGTLYQGV